MVGLLIDLRKKKIYHTKKVMANRTKKIENIKPALEEERQPSVGQNKYKSYIQQTTNNKQQTTLLLLFQKSLYLFHHFRSL